MLENGFQESSLQQLSRDQCEDDQPVVPWILLLALLEDWSNSCFLPVQPSGTGPHYHDLSKIIESALQQYQPAPSPLTAVSHQDAQVFFHFP